MALVHKLKLISVLLFTSCLRRSFELLSKVSELCLGKNRVQHNDKYAKQYDCPCFQVHHTVP